MSASAAHGVQAVVVGAGVVGLACARSLAMAGLEVLILERETAFGSGTSSRNSEVVHSGVYYPPGSLKAQLCVEGRRYLYDYCAHREVTARKVGKLIVATTDSQAENDLPALLRTGTRNGVEGLRLMSREDVRRKEPELECRGALWSPETGIVDSHALMSALLDDAERCGAFLAVQSELADVRRSEHDDDVLSLRTADGTRLECKYLVNAAGLTADRVAAGLLSTETATPTPRHYFAKGNYYRLEGVPTPFSRLIYPVPDGGGLGVHATIDIAGNCRFGPDVEWLDFEADREELDNFTVDPARAAGFYEVVRRYWPDLPDGALAPDYAGIRPKLGHPDVVGTNIKCDFRIDGPKNHKIPGFVSLTGMESPGLTSSLAVGDYVKGLLLIGK